MGKKLDKIVKTITKTSENVNREISMFTSCAAARIEVGYIVGYYKALQDVLLFLGGELPQRKDWWERMCDGCFEIDGTTYCRIGKCMGEQQF